MTKYFGILNTSDKYDPGDIISKKITVITEPDPKQEISAIIRKAVSYSMEHVYAVEMVSDESIAPHAQSDGIAWTKFKNAIVVQKIK